MEIGVGAMCSRSISRILFPSSEEEGLLPFIYATYPPGLRQTNQTSSLQTQVYMVLQPARFTQCAVTDTARELLPHVFTLTCFYRGRNIGVLFSVALSDSPRFRLGHPRFLGVRCSELSGLSSIPPRRDSDRTIWSTKLSLISDE